jgi:putative (di)nucleoside polyphosphate hydrolase
VCRVYRSGVGACLVSEGGLILVCNRIDGAGWQLPQGGVDQGETASEALKREVLEEIGLEPDHYTIITRTEEIKYNIPPSHLPKSWGGKYIGQSQNWFLLHATLSSLEKIDFHRNKAVEPEFKAWKLISPHSLQSVAVSFKRQIYLELLKQFEPHINKLKQ